MSLRAMLNRFIITKSKYILSNEIGSRLPVVTSNRFFTTQPSEEEFNVIYQSKYAFVGGIINKIKKYQLVATGLAVPGSYAAHLASLCDYNLVEGLFVAGISSTAAVFMVGQIFSSMIGYIYVTKDLQKVKLSYVDFWGGRKDIVVFKEELLPIPNSISYPTDILYRRINRYSSPRSHKISFTFGNITNPEAFNYVFEYLPESS